MTDETQTELEYEQVYTVTDYWDGPRAGLANFKGRPHYYQCVFDESIDDWSQIFLLHPVTPEVFDLALEAWRIWERWCVAHADGKVNIDGHPALPEDRERHEELARILRPGLVADPDKDIRAEGKFEVVEPKRKGQPIAGLKVKWSLVT